MLLKEYSLAVRKGGGEIFVHRCSTGRVSFHLDNDVWLLSISHLNTKYGVGINELWCMLLAITRKIQGAIINGIFL